MTKFLTRFFDICFSLLGLIVGFPLLMLLLIIGLFDTGSPLFTQRRVGLNKKTFTLLKFRTMRKEAAQVASHLADKSDITAYGRFLRRSKLDELPQLWNVVKGEMSLVGPRPCLCSQHELIAERCKQKVFDVRPGITGLAQLNNIDMSTPSFLAETDAEMIRDMTIKKYFKYILQTVVGKGGGDAIT